MTNQQNPQNQHHEYFQLSSVASSTSVAKAQISLRSCNFRCWQIFVYVEEELCPLCLVEVNTEATRTSWGCWFLHSQGLLLICLALGASSSVLRRHICRQSLSSAVLPVRCLGVTSLPGCHRCLRHILPESELAEVGCSWLPEALPIRNASPRKRYHPGIHSLMLRLMLAVLSSGSNNLVQLVELHTQPASEYYVANVQRASSCLACFWFFLQGHGLFESMW